MKKKNKNIAGKIITVLQLIVSVICIVVAKNSGLFPRKYLTLFIVGLGFLFVLTHVFQYPKSKILRYVGMLTSLVIIIVLAGISVELMKADDFIKKVGGASYKTDNMIVVVKKEDTAKDIMDAQDYRFGYQTIVDVDNTEKMLKDIRSTVGRNIKTEGTVKNVTDFGAFIDLGGADGLLHISEMSWGRVESPKKMFKVGDTVKAFIKDINGDKIALSLKFDETNPWLNAEEKYAVGTVVTGKIARMTDFGAFVELEPGVDALLHVSQISYDHVAKPEDVYKIGDEIEAKVVDFKPEEKKISLSVKALLPAPEETEEVEEAPVEE